jgi:hypothetical protein
VESTSTSDAVLEPLFLPYTESQLCQHFLGSGPSHVAKWRKRIDEARVQQAEDPSFLYRDETLWTAGALLGVDRHVDRRARWHSLLARAFGPSPPLDEPASWENFLDGRFELYFEVGLSSPAAYRRWLQEHLAERHPLASQVELGRTRGIALERHTKLDALLLNTDQGYAVHFESKVLSDIDPKTTFDAVRNQLARNLDAMHAPAPDKGTLSKRRPDRSVLALLTPELFRARRSSRLYGHLYDEYRRNASSLRRVLEHLDQAACASLARRIGWLTFEDIAREFPGACRWLPSRATGGHG